MYLNLELVAICKVSNGLNVGKSGYVAISLATVYLVVDTDENKHMIWPTPKPTRS